MKSRPPVFRGAGLGQPVLDSSLGLVDELQLPAAHLIMVLRHDTGDGVFQNFLLKISGDPSELGQVHQRFDARIISGKGSVIQIGGVVQMPRIVARIHLDI